MKFYARRVGKLFGISLILFRFEIDILLWKR